MEVNFFNDIGRYIDAISEFKNEKEWLLPYGCVFKIFQIYQ